MRTSVTPASLLVHQVDAFLRHWPGVRDGDAEAIHDARVATRRMRELLPLVAAYFTPSDAEGLERVVERATRHLGRARDVDVVLELMQSIETALPEAAGELAAARVQLLRRRERRVKRAIKALEHLEMPPVIETARVALGVAAPAPIALRRHGSAAVRWEDVLAAQLRERAGNLKAAVDRAGGLLFPNRLHEARIAMKKLRYAVEISIETGHKDLEHLLRPLRKGQELLGRLHDLDVLAEALRATGTLRPLPFVDYQRRRLHDRYLTRRPALLDACSAAARAASRDHRLLTVRRTALAASLPLALLAIPLVRRRIA